MASEMKPCLADIQVRHRVHAEDVRCIQQEPVQARQLVGSDQHRGADVLEQQHRLRHGPCIAHTWCLPWPRTSGFKAATQHRCSACRQLAGRLLSAPMSVFAMASNPGNTRNKRVFCWSSGCLQIQKAWPFNRVLTRSSEMQHGWSMMACTPEVICTQALILKDAPRRLVCG